jgi:hypothetical protein
MHDDNFGMPACERPHAERERKCTPLIAPYVLRLDWVHSWGISMLSGMRWADI